MELPFTILTRLEALIRRHDCGANAELRGAVQELRASLEASHANVEQLSRAQADAIAHSAVLISEVDQARAEAEASRHLAETARQRLDELVEQRTFELHATDLKLQASQAQLQAIMDHTPAVVFMKDLDGRFLFVNRRFENLFHISAQEAVGKTDHDLFPYEAADSFRAHDQAVLAAGAAQESEERVPQDDGLHTYISLKFPLRDPKGQVYAICGIATDITERKRLEEDQFKFAALVQNSSDFVSLANLDGRVTFVNRAGRKMLGLGDSLPLPTCSILDFVHPDAHERCRQTILPAFEATGQWDGEICFRHFQTGAAIPMEMTSFLVRDPQTGQQLCMATVSRDITERQRAEGELLEERNFSRLLIDSLPGIVYYFDETGKFLRWNKNFEQVTGFSADEIAVMSPDDFFDPQDKPRIREVFEAGAADVEADLITRGGQRIPYLFRGLRFVRNEHPFVVGVGLDIRARKQAEEALRQLNAELETRIQERTVDLERSNAELRDTDERVRLLLNSSGEAIYGVDQEGTCTVCNTACARLLGYDSPDQLVGHSMHTLMHHTRPDGTPYPVGECRMASAIRKGEQINVEDEVFWRKDGTSFPVEYRSYPMRREGQVVGAVAWFSDITERRRNEEMIRERQRLTALTGDIGIALTQEASLPTLLQRSADALVEHLGAAFARVWTLNAKTNVLELKASAGLYTHLDGGHARVPVGKFKIGLIAQERKPHLTNQVIGDPRVGDQEWARREGMVAFAGYPLVVGGQVWGVMAMFARQPLAEATLETLAIIADEVGLGIARMETLETLKASEETFRGISNTALDGVIVMDSAGIVRHWNPAAERILGYSPEEILGKNLHETLTSQDYRSQIEKGLEHFVRTGTGAVIGRVQEVEALHKDGRRLPIELSVAAIQREGEWQAVGILRDITERKKVEEAQRQAKEAAEATARAKSEFLANMSHEIRTPLNGMLGMTELALDTELTATQRDYLQTARASGEALLRVINDILDFSKIEAGKLEFIDEDFSLQATLGQVMKTLAVRAHQKGLDLSYHVEADVPDGLRGDTGRLSQVLINLVGNAIKFTERGEVAVNVVAEPVPDVCLLHFRVRDTGPGIPPDQQQRIFEAFNQVDASIARRHGGTGLGLTISARLVERMGGRIWVESEPGKGSRFHFTIRLSRAHAPNVGLVLRPPVKLQGLPVLVVDDNATNRQIMAETLKRWQVQPMAVDNGAAALQALESAQETGEPFALVITDGNMPGMDGFTLAQHIRQHAVLRGTPLLMLTSADRSADLQHCRELNIEGYLRKPVAPAELLEAVTRVLRISFQGTRKETVPAPAVVQQQRALRILLAEDNPINQQVAIQMLQKEGHTVVTADDGKAAITRWEREPFDLVLMDVQMPEMDGFAATNVIREKEQQTGRHIPIIALTAHAMKGDRERCLAAGMDEYLSKPIRADDLRSTIRTLMGTKNAAAPAVQDDAAARAWDPGAVLAELDGDRGLLAKLIQCFQDQCRDILAEVKQASAQADWIRLERAAHKLKGSIANFQAPPAYEAARKVEELASTPDRIGLEHAQAGLEKSLARLQEELRHFAKEGSP